MRAPIFQKVDVDKKPIGYLEPGSVVEILAVQLDKHNHKKMEHSRGWTPLKNAGGALFFERLDKSLEPAPVSSPTKAVQSTVESVYFGGPGSVGLRVSAVQREIIVDQIYADSQAAAFSETVKVGQCICAVVPQTASPAAPLWSRDEGPIDAEMVGKMLLIGPVLVTFDQPKRAQTAASSLQAVFRGKKSRQESDQSVPYDGACIFSAAASPCICCVHQCLLATLSHLPLKTGEFTVEFKKGAKIRRLPTWSGEEMGRAPQGTVCTSSKICFVPASKKGGDPIERILITYNRKKNDPVTGWVSRLSNNGNFILKETAAR
jgi:hypothetical protein